MFSRSNSARMCPVTSSDIVNSSAKKKEGFIGILAEDFDVN